jgi:hypothetical protein
MAPFPTLSNTFSNTPISANFAALPAASSIASSVSLTGRIFDEQGNES